MTTKPKPALVETTIPARRIISAKSLKNNHLAN
jgi:hypothetical protein